MFPYLVSFLYILSALGVGALARQTRMGWFGAFLLSLLVTPIVTFILVVGFMQPARRRGDG